jgi:hypothetical protein
MFIAELCYSELYTLHILNFAHLESFLEVEQVVEH